MNNADDDESPCPIGRIGVVTSKEFTGALLCIKHKDGTSAAGVLERGYIQTLIAMLRSALDDESGDLKMSVDAPVTYVSAGEQ